MASSLETNKILAAILTAGIFASGAGVASRIIYHPAPPEEPSYLIEVAATAVESGGDQGEAEVTLASLLPAADVAAGEKVAKKCAACHTFDDGGANKIGPNLWGILGRDIGAVDGFAYSDALTGLGGSWDFDSLDAFLAKPKDFAPGTKMAYAGMKNAGDRADLILYLRSLAADPLPLPEAEEQESAENIESEAEGATAVEETAEAAAEVVEETAAVVADQTEEAVEGAMETAEAATEAASDVVEQAAEAAGNASKAVADTASEAAESATEAAVEATETVTEAAGTLVDSASENAGDAKDAVADTVTEAADAAATMAADATETVTEAATALVDSASEQAAEVKDQIADAATAAAGAASAAVGATVAAVTEGGEAADEAGSEAGGLVAMIAGGDLAAGEKVSKKCKACHVFKEGGKKRLGPPLWGIVGSDIASQDGFVYSPALQELEGDWTYEKLDQFLAAPKSYVPGTKMVFAGVKKEADRANLILYLRSLAAEPFPLAGGG